MQFLNATHLGGGREQSVLCMFVLVWLLLSLTSLCVGYIAAWLQIKLVPLVTLHLIYFLFFLSFNNRKCHKAAAHKSKCRQRICACKWRNLFNYTVILFERQWRALCAIWEGNFLARHDSRPIFSGPFNYTHRRNISKQQTANELKVSICGLTQTNKCERTLRSLINKSEALPMINSIRQHKGERFWVTADTWGHLFSTVFNKVTQYSVCRKDVP